MEGRNEKGQFVKGHNFGKGRPKGSKDKLSQELIKAIREVEKEEGKGLFKHFVKRGYKNDSVLVALIRKLIADKTQTDIDLSGEVKKILVINRLNENRKTLQRGKPTSVSDSGTRK